MPPPWAVMAIRGRVILMDTGIIPAHHQGIDVIQRRRRGRMNDRISFSDQHLDMHLQRSLSPVDGINQRIPVNGLGFVKGGQRRRGDDLAGYWVSPAVQFLPPKGGRAQRREQQRESNPFHHGVLFSWMGLENTSIDFQERHGR